WQIPPSKPRSEITKITNKVTDGAHLETTPLARKRDRLMIKSLRNRSLRLPRLLKPAKLIQQQLSLSHDGDVVAAVEGAPLLKETVNRQRQIRFPKREVKRPLKKRVRNNLKNNPGLGTSLLTKGLQDQIELSPRVRQSHRMVRKQVA
ncbi:MAG: hypothetical protein ABW100_15270, partial [Candidatus Thiodiazotropha sp. 6PLUC3]